jgi:single-strand DNA-binding protein
MNEPSWFKPEDRPAPGAHDPTINRVELVGYVGQDPEVRHTPTYEMVVSFGLATHRLDRGADGEIIQRTDWHRIVTEGEQAVLAADLRRGALVKVAGRLRTRSWATARGDRRVRTEVIASELRQVRRAPRFQQASLPLI